MSSYENINKFINNKPKLPIFTVKQGVNIALQHRMFAMQKSNTVFDGYISGEAFNSGKLPTKMVTDDFGGLTKESDKLQTIEIPTKITAFKRIFIACSPKASSYMTAYYYARSFSYYGKRNMYLYFK